VEAGIIELLLNKEAVFFALFLYLFWNQQKEKKEQNIFILRQQDILGELTESFKKLSNSQEVLTERVEKIEVHVGDLKGDENHVKKN